MKRRHSGSAQPTVRTSIRVYDEATRKWVLPSEMSPTEPSPKPPPRTSPPLKAVPTPVTNPAPAEPETSPNTPVLPIANSAIAADAIAIPAPQVSQKILGGERWTGVPNALIDDVLRTLKPTDQAVLFQLFRNSWGRHRPTCKMSHAELARRSGISKRQAQVSAARLEDRRLVRRVDVGERAIPEYEMLVPPAVGKAAESPIAKSATYKDKSIKDQNKEGSRSAPEQKPDPNCPLCFGSGFEKGERGVKGRCPRCKGVV